MISGDGKLPLLEILPGRFYGPCSGRDISIAIELFGNLIDRFTFCDLSYRGPNFSAKEAVPDNWALTSRVQGFDQAVPEKTTWYGRSPFRPRSTLESWRRPDLSEVLIELRCDLAQDVLTEQFAPGSISAFMHINDGTGEGGSDLWFLTSPSMLAERTDHAKEFLPQLVRRLCDGAIVVTDGVLTDPNFRCDKSFELAHGRWELISSFSNARRPDRPLRAWRVNKPAGKE